MTDVMKAILAEIREGLEDEFCDRTYLLESVEEQLAGLLEYCSGAGAEAVAK
ncbi:hypothetical protein ABH926_005067 [Catenulispora sp. GP43]|uniref:hypothetical protein n=1 Tax=Catenulispora sp. GP43 TaxID=3156263 RepID=UPI0035122912